MDFSFGKFKNFDNVSCYMISILHILQYIPIFNQFIINTNFKENTIVNTLSNLIKISNKYNKYSIVPKNFKDVIANKNSLWGELEHQDSQEFFNFLISTIEEEIGYKIEYIPKFNSSKIDNNNYLLELIAQRHIQNVEKNDYSIIKKFFIGYQMSNITCSLCNTSSPSFESFITLSLTIPYINYEANKVYTLEECFDYMIKIETLDNNNKCKCNICGYLNNSYKETILWKTPDILVIHLKKFDYNMNKINNPIIYPLDNLNLDYYFNNKSPYSQNNNYKLIGINIHIGFSLHAGHYISYICINNKWFLFDDDNEPIEINESILQNRNAYLLFYCKV